MVAAANDKTTAEMCSALVRNTSTDQPLYFGADASCTQTRFRDSGAERILGGRNRPIDLFVRVRG